MEQKGGHTVSVDLDGKGWLLVYMGSRRGSIIIVRVVKQVTSMQQILVEWLKMQAAWMYLEPIFGSQDIMEQMPKEGGLFHDVDKVWRVIIEAARKTTQMLDVSPMATRSRRSHDISPVKGLTLIQLCTNIFLMY